MLKFTQYLACLGLSLALLPWTALSQSPDNTLTPTSPWQVNYDDYDCKLTREFGAGESYQLQFMSGGPLNRFSLVLITSELRFINRRAPVKIRTIPQNFTFETYGTVGYLRDDPRYLLRIPNLPVAILDAFADRQAFEISIGERFHRSFEVENFQAAVSEWRSCQHDLLESWGFNPDEQLGLGRLPTPVSIWGWIRASDYSEETIDEMERDAVVVRVALNAQGLVQECATIRSSGAAEFDRITCDMLTERAQFEPALSAEGRPVEISIPFVVGWIPDTE